MTPSECNFLVAMNGQEGRMQFIGSKHEGFHFGNEFACVYRPDFYDSETGEYYEVKASRTAYITAAYVLCGFRFHNPNIPFHVVTPSGVPCENVWRFQRTIQEKTILRMAEVYHIDLTWLREELKRRFAPVS
jgi:hypothetical protein